MEYIDIRVRMPVAKLGSFVQLLPEWAQMIGYDKLKRDYTEGKPREPNGEYVPRVGSVVETMLKYVADKGPVQRIEIFKTLGKKHDERALSSAFSVLRDRRGLIQKQTDGSYAVKTRKG